MGPVMSMKRDVRRLKEDLEPLGFQFDCVTQNMHYKWRHPKLRVSLVTVSKLDDNRTYRNTLATAKRLLRSIENGS